jgi:hypothetical protein
MLCYCPCVVVCVGVVVTYVSPILSSLASSPCPWSFCPRRIRPARPCRGCHRRLALRASRRMTTTMRTPQASLVFRRCTMASLLCSSSLFVSVIVVIGVVLPKCHSLSRCSPTTYSPASASASSSSLLSSVATLLPLLPYQSFCPMKRNNIDHGHRHRHGRCTPHRHRHSARHRRDYRAEEDPICQAEEGIVQAALGVSTVTSVVLLLLRCLHRRRRCR